MGAIFFFFFLILSVEHTSFCHKVAVQCSQSSGKAQARYRSAQQRWSPAVTKQVRRTKRRTKTPFQQPVSHKTQLIAIKDQLVSYSGRSPILTSQSYNSLSCSMIHSSSTSLFLSSFLSYFTVTLPCFFCTGSSVVMGLELTHPTPGAAWKNTRLPAVGSGALVSVLAADIAERTAPSGLGKKKVFKWMRGCKVQRGLSESWKADRRVVRRF